MTAAEITEGLERKPGKAKAFYAVIAAATLLGAAMNFWKGFDPIRALVWAAMLLTLGDGTALLIKWLWGA